MEAIKKRLIGVIEGFYKRDHLGKRLVLVLTGVFFMAFSLSFLQMVDLGTDPFTNMNLAIISHLGWSIGNWQALLNTVSFIIVIIFGANDIGFGTLANMLLIGYMLQFYNWLWPQVLPEGWLDPMWVRILVMIVALAVFVFSCSLYIDGGLGSSPYDAIPFIIHRKISKIPLRFVRMAFDLSVVGIACLFGSKLYPVTLLMSLALGPTIELVNKGIKKMFKWANETPDDKKPEEIASEENVAPAVENIEEKED